MGMKGVFGYRFYRHYSSFYRLSMTSLRLQKYLSECGICSRRHAEEAIKNGEVIVNGTIAQIGQSIDPDKDKVEFSGKLVNRSE